MRRFTTIVILFTLFFLSCQAVALPLTGFPPASRTPLGELQSTSTIAAPPETSTATPSPSQTATSSPSPGPSATPTTTPMSGEGFDVRFHPDGDLYVGDQVSMEVIAPPGADLKDREVQVQVDGQQVEQSEPAKFEPFGIAGRQQATLFWAWDTAGFEPGEHSLSFSIQPQGPSWDETVTLQPAADVPPPEPGAYWATTETDCCQIYYITGTDAERDLQEVEKMVDEQAQDVVQKLQTNFEKAIPIVFLPRVLGHGGFASDAISISYLDRNYAGSSPALVIHHEMIHILDSRLGGELRPTILVEGLAVYLTGGHFKPEVLMPRAAVLLDTGRYLPLVSLADQFYPSQHETGYLEAASLIEYMVKTWGWGAFSDFYRDIHPAPDKSQSAAIDAALRKHFNLSFTELEDRFKEALRAIPITPDLRDDVRLTLEYYDTVRRYQVALDPSAYFTTAWLPDSKEMRERGIVADYLRHPRAPENLALETMLVSVDDHLRAADYEVTDELIGAVNAVLDRIDGDSPNPFAVEPLASDYFEIIQVLTGEGYEPQKVEVDGDSALAWATTSGPELHELALERRQGQWTLLKQTSEVLSAPPDFRSLPRFYGQANKTLNGGVQYRFK